MSEPTSEPGRHTRYRIAADVRYRIVDGQAVIIVQNAGEAVVLNEMGTRILELIRRETEVDTIVTELAAEFEAGEEEIRADVLAYLADLVDAGVANELGERSTRDSGGSPPRD